jgi:LysR substrate binding domain
VDLAGAVPLDRSCDRYATGIRGSRQRRALRRLLASEVASSARWSPAAYALAAARSRRRSAGPRAAIRPAGLTELAFVAPASDPELARRARLGGGHWNGLPVILPRRGRDRQRVDAWLELQGVRPDVYAEVDGNEALVALVALGCGVVPELVRKDSPFRGCIAEVDVKRPPRGYHVSLCAKTGTLSRRTAAVLWDLPPRQPRSDRLQQSALLDRATLTNMSRSAPRFWPRMRPLPAISPPTGHVHCKVVPAYVRC